MTPAQKAERLEDVAVAMIPELDTEQVRRIFEACDQQLALRERCWQTRSTLLQAAMRGASEAWDKTAQRDVMIGEYEDARSQVDDLLLDEKLHQGANVAIREALGITEGDTLPGARAIRSQVAALTKALKRCRGLLSLRLRGCVQDRLASPAEQEAHRLADRAIKGAVR